MSTYYIAGIPFDGINAISHHGILGQQWGKRNGPPYPLKPEDHSKSEEKSGWKKSLEGYGRYYKTKNERKKEAKIEYHKQVKKMPEWIAKKNYKKSLNEIEEELKKLYPAEAQNNEKLRKIAKGALIAAGVAVGIAGAATMASATNELIVQFDIGEKFRTSRASELIGNVMDDDINKLSDLDEVVSAGTILQRVIRSGDNLEDTLNIESAKDFIYATFKPGDNEIYKTLFNARGIGKRIATTREVLSDLKMPSAFKSASTFKELLSNKEFKKALAKDFFGPGFNTFPTGWTDGQMWNLFNSIAGDSGKESPKIFFKAIQEKGYNAIRDYNDSGYLGDAPIILLNASSDTMLTGKKAIGAIESWFGGLKLRSIPDYDKKLIYR